MLMNLVMLQAEAQNPIVSLLPMLLIIVIFYFFFIRPQNKKQKEINTFRAQLKTGDRIITAGGLHGVLKEINDETVVVEIAQNVKVTVDKAQIFPSVDTGVKSDK